MHALGFEVEQKEVENMIESVDKGVSWFSIAPQTARNLI
jgi:hypothetical protein